MRVIAGSAKGHHLRAPKGMQTRPTSDKVREAIFAMLGDACVDVPVLDLFAGTGALGIEALSRGASRGVFVEHRPAACETIRANLRHTRFHEVGRLLCMSVERSLTTLNEPFGLILVDPPYDHPHLHAIMTLIGGARVIESGTTIVFEHSPRFVVERRYARMVLRRQKVYGDTAVSIFDALEEESA